MSDLIALMLILACTSFVWGPIAGLLFLIVLCIAHIQNH